MRLKASGAIVLQGAAIVLSGAAMLQLKRMGAESRLANDLLISWIISGLRLAPGLTIRQACHPHRSGRAVVLRQFRDDRCPCSRRLNGTAPAVVDSARIAGMMDLMIFQGDWFAAVRWA
ncbi:MAG: hypothetical protein ACKO45_14240 [Cyanobium sp.]